MIFHLLRSLGKKEMTTPSLVKERNQNSCAGKRRILNRLSLSAGKKSSDLIHKIFLTGSHSLLTPTLL
jgi:hypothetical protein